MIPILAKERQARSCCRFNTLYTRLDTLRSLNEANLLIPGGPQEYYHELVEEAYALLGKIETEVDALREELEYQHQRLDSARDAALAEARRRNLDHEPDINT